MQAERWREIEHIYHSARRRAPEDRCVYLEEACQGDEDLISEVRSLLANDDRAASFLETDPRSADLHPPSLAAGEKIGPYVVIDFLRAGGMGEVYKARDTRLDRIVAIKFVPPALAADPAALSRFQREARAASSLNHPRICTVHDIGDYQGRPFFVMEYLEGQSLRDRLAHGPLPLAELLDLAAQICEALQAAHGKGIVHRDIKPGNIFILANGQVKILDFGLAKSLSDPGKVDHCVPDAGAAPVESAITIPGSAAGTMAYMSLEQLRGEPVDARADLFSLGVTLYQMATGELPFKSETPALTREAILNRQPAAPRQINPRLPAELERILLKALQNDPSARYASAAEMRSALERVSGGSSHRRWLAAAVATLAAALGLTAAGMKLGRFGTGSPAPHLTPRQITANPPEDPIMQASLSPDGQTIAYEDFSGIHLRRIATGETRLFPPPDDYCYR